jgi:hypothetical protein
MSLEATAARNFVFSHTCITIIIITHTSGCFQRNQDRGNIKIQLVRHNEDNAGWK